jgi:hypothetical protein
LIVGGAILALGLAGFYDLGFGQGAAPLTGACIPVMMLGAYIVWWATRPLAYLRLRARRGAHTTMIVLGDDIESLPEILERARRHFGYAVRWKLELESVESPYRDTIRTLRGA